MKSFYKITLCLLCISIQTNAFAAKQTSEQELIHAYNVLVKKTPAKQAPAKKHIAAKQYVKTTKQTKRTPQINAVLMAKKQINKKYRWGGTDPYNGFDCSGLMQYVYKASRVHIPRTAAAQFKHTKRISMKNLKVGDLIFFHTRRTRAKVNHVGIYLGGGKFIHAPRRGKLVSITDLNSYWRRKAVGAGRV
ncbi:MAG: C40 family peptidase [Cocleimonas sp.]